MIGKTFAELVDDHIATPGNVRRFTDDKLQGTLQQLTHVFEF